MGVNCPGGSTTDVVECAPDRTALIKELVIENRTATAHVASVRLARSGSYGHLCYKLGVPANSVIRFQGFWVLEPGDLLQVADTSGTSFISAWGAVLVGVWTE